MPDSVDTSEYWAHPAVAGVDLMRARFVRHSFARHSHDFFAIGVTVTGVERLRIGADVRRVGPGMLVLLNPDVVHTGAPADEDGWAYRVLYPDVATVCAATGRAQPFFADPVVHDPAGAESLLHAHRSTQDSDRLESSVALYRALALLGARHGERQAPGTEAAAGGSAAGRARELLHERLIDPPSLDELAAAVGTGKFALLRAFRDRYGLPPHAYLNMVRVHRACALLDAGHGAAEVAQHVGFCDQPHLTRQFRRVVGVPPAQYQRKNVQAAR